MSLNSLGMLCRYKQWADARIYESLACVPYEVITVDRKIVFGSILATLHHVCLLDKVWRCHLEGVAHNVVSRNPIDSPPLLDLLNAQCEMDSWFIDYSEQLTGEICDEIVEFTFIDGGAGSMTRAETLQHVCNHTTYHRGHIAAMMYESNTSPPTTDLPVFLRAR